MMKESADGIVRRTHHNRGLQAVVNQRKPFKHATISMQTPERIEIPVGKKKATVALLISLIFVAIGVWLLGVEPREKIPFFRQLHVVMSYALIFFFGFGVLVCLRVLFLNRPGLILDEAGITDQSNSAVGLIAWSDVTDISVSLVANQISLTITVQNPDEYINRQKSRFARMMLRANWSTFGSPLVISSETLAISLVDLGALMMRKWYEWQLEQESAPPDDCPIHPPF